MPFLIAILTAISVFCILMALLRSRREQKLH